MEKRRKNSIEVIIYNYYFFDPECDEKKDKEILELVDAYSAD